MIYGYMIKSKEPAFEFFAKEATKDDGSPILCETTLDNGLVVFPVWREERPAPSMPRIRGYTRMSIHDTRPFHEQRHEFVDIRDFDPLIHTEQNEWFPVGDYEPTHWNAAYDHENASKLHEQAQEAFNVWKYLPRDVPDTVKEQLRELYKEKAAHARKESERLGFSPNHTVADDYLEVHHGDMVRKHKELARIYSL